jgi:diguanylate cyclase (GGDEF)-like protein
MTYVWLRMKPAGESMARHEDPVTSGGGKDKAWALVITDPQTGLPNEMVVQDRLNQALVRQPRHGGEVVIITVILDNLAVINEERGFDVGNTVLLEAANRLTHALRTEDTVGRTGKYELKTVVTVAEEKNVGPLTDRLRKVLDEPIDAGDLSLQLESTLDVRRADPNR